MAACQHQCQQLRFRWNDHVSHLSKFLAAQRHEEQFCDITLVSEDGYVLKGHQAILSSTSGYFKRVLDNVTSDQHPIVVLQGAKHAELSCLMEYIYQGVTQVNHQFMESVIDVADMLEIKGLSRMKSNSSIKKLFHATAVHSPTSLHSPQCFHPSPSRSPSPHYSGSQPPSSPTPYPSLSKMDSIQDADTAISNVETEDECSEAAQETSSDRVMRSRVSGIEYSDPVQSQNLPHADSYSDQTSGIDLSISRGGGTECSSKESYQESTLNDRMFKKRKLMEKVEEKVNDPMTDPDWGRIPDKQKDEHMPLKHKRFAKPSTRRKPSFSDVPSSDSDFPSSKRSKLGPYNQKEKLESSVSENDISNQPCYIQDLNEDSWLTDDSIPSTQYRLNEAGSRDNGIHRGLPPQDNDSMELKPYHISKDWDDWDIPSTSQGLKAVGSKSLIIPRLTFVKSSTPDTNEEDSDIPSEFEENISEYLPKFNSQFNRVFKRPYTHRGVAISNSRKPVAEEPYNSASVSRYDSDSESSTSTSYKSKDQLKIPAKNTVILPSCVALNLNYRKSYITSYEPPNDFVRSLISRKKNPQDPSENPTGKSKQPTPPLNSFAIFVKEFDYQRSQDANSQNGSDSSGPMLSLAAKAWKSLTKEEKAPYEKKARQMKLEYYKKYPSHGILKTRKGKKKRLTIDSIFSW